MFMLFLLDHGGQIKGQFFKLAPLILGGFKPKQRKNDVFCVVLKLTPLILRGFKRKQRENGVF